MTIAPIPAPAGGLSKLMVFTMPLQLLTYHIVVLMGADLDKPRNLATSVTVECGLSCPSTASRVS
jgi:glucosamine--fructose-6-phosphate aminotransferase (isomerizing)